MWKLFCAGLFFLFACVTTHAQQYGGTWEGEFRTDMSQTPRTFRFFVLLEQDGKELNGIYISGDSNSVKKANCVCQISGRIGKKASGILSMYKDGIINSNIPEDVCDFLQYLEMRRLAKDNRIYLVGNWYGKLQSPFRTDGASGSFVLQKLSDSMYQNLSYYLPEILSKKTKKQPDSARGKTVKEDKLAFNKRESNIQCCGRYRCC